MRWLSSAARRTRPIPRPAPPGRCRTGSWRSLEVGGGAVQRVAPDKRKCQVWRSGGIAGPALVAPSAQIVRMVCAQVAGRIPPRAAPTSAAQLMVFDTAPVGALSTPVFVYDATVKYHVPALSPSIRALVVAGLAISSTVDSSVDDLP